MTPCGHDRPTFGCVDCIHVVRLDRYRGDIATWEMGDLLDAWIDAAGWRRDELEREIDRRTEGMRA